MRLLFNSERVLAHIAADAARSSGDAPLPFRVAWRPRVEPVEVVVGPPTPGVDDLGPTRARLEDAIRVAVVGEPEEIGTTLVSDARGWSPTVSYSSRAEALVRHEQALGTMPVAEFRISGLCWAPPLAFAEWRLRAVFADPLLIGEDVLIEPSGRGITLAGATVARIRAGRISASHTYFDDAALIEQVIADRWRGDPAAGHDQGPWSPRRPVP